MSQLGIATEAVSLDGYRPCFSLTFFGGYAAQERCWAGNW